jgi:hypothetical protein
MLISDFAICLNAVIKHYEWELYQIPFPSEEQAWSAKWLAILSDKNIGKCTLTSIRQLLAVECCSPLWQYVFIVMGTLIAALLIVLIGYSVFTHHLVTLKQCSICLIWLFLTEPLCNVLQPPALSAPAAPPSQSYQTSVTYFHGGATTFDQPSWQFYFVLCIKLSLTEKLYAGRHYHRSATL